MLESLGYSEAPSAPDADLILFNTCSIRESADSRFVAHLGEAKRLKRERPELVVGVGGCWAQSVKEEVFERFPFVDVAFGPGQVHKLGEFLTSDSLSAQGYFEFEGFTGRLPARRERPFQGWVQISVGCNCRCSYCIVPSTRGREVSRPLEELVAEVRGMAGEGVSEVTLLGQNVNSYGRDLRVDGRARSFAELLRADRRDRGHRAHPLHEPASEGHARGRDPRARRAAQPLRAHPPAAAVRLQPRAEGDAPHLRSRALPRPCGADPRARARCRAQHRHHRRLPRARPRRTSGRRSRSSRRSATTAPSPSSSRPAGAPRRRRWTRRFVPQPTKVERMERLVEVVQRRAAERAQRFVGRTLEVLVEGASRTAPERLRGRTRHNKVVNFSASRRRASSPSVRIDGATSQTLSGEEAPARPRSRLSRLTAAPATWDGGDRPRARPPAAADDGPPPSPPLLVGARRAARSGA